MEELVVNNGADTQEVVSAVDLMGEEALEDAIEGAEEEGEEPQAAAAKTYTQQEFDNAVRQRARYIEQGAERKLKDQMEKDPIYQMGKKLSEIQSAKTGKSPTEAAQDAANSFLEMQAQELAKDPVALSRTLLNAQIPAPQPQPQINPVADRLAGEMVTLVRSGALPRDFDLNAMVQSNPDFLQQCMDKGVYNAYQSIQQRQQKAQQNRELPGSTRPGHNEGPSDVDYENMSSEDFRKLKERMMNAHLSGKRVQL